MSREAKNDSSLQVILQILFIGLIGLLPSYLRYFGEEISKDEYIAMDLYDVCKKLNTRLIEIASKRKISVTSALEDFILMSQGREMNHLSEKDFNHLNEPFHHTNPKCKTLIIQNPSLVYQSYKRES